MTDSTKPDEGMKAAVSALQQLSLNNATSTGASSHQENQTRRTVPLETNGVKPLEREGQRGGQQSKGRTRGRGRGGNGNRRANGTKENSGDAKFTSQKSVKPHRNHRSTKNNTTLAEGKSGNLDATMTNTASGASRNEKVQSRADGGRGKEMQSKPKGGHHSKNGGNHGKNRTSRLRKPKNTTDFTPRYDKPDLRLVFGHSKDLTAPKLTVHDVMFVPELFCKQDDMTLYEALLKELEEATKTEDRELFQLWHGDSHVIANDRVQGGKWKKASPAFTRIIERIETYFGMKIAATRLNWYRPGTVDWKPFHHDRAAFTPGCPQNLTVAATLGPSHREVGFQHAKHGTKLFFGVPNGSAYTFSRDVNCEWKHGVIPVQDPAQHKGRISIIAWGLAEQDTSGSRITENDVPTAQDLGLA